MDKIQILAESPITWGIVTLVVAAVAFSGKLSIGLSNGCLFLAFLAGCYGVYRLGYGVHFSIILCLILGISITALSWWIQPTIGNSPKASTPEEIARAVKKEIAPDLKRNGVMTYPPDVSKATKTAQIKSLDQFNPNLGERLRDLRTFPPGGFELSANPSPEDHYSSFTVVTKEVFGTHYYASVRLAGLENVQTMDLIGKNICVCVDPTWRKYFIWESEQSQVAWRDVNVQLHESMNTLAVYQKGRDVSVFINNEYVAHFETLKTPSAGPVGIQIKANRQKGGKLYFRDLSIWEFPD